MYLFYVDESGNTGADLDSADQPIHWLVALAVSPPAVMRIETELLGIAAQYFGPRARQADFELHGADIFSGRTPDFRRLSVADRVNLYGELLTLIGDAGGMLFIRGIDKGQHKKRSGRGGYAPDHPHRARAWV